MDIQIKKMEDDLYESSKLGVQICFHKFYTVKSLLIVFFYLLIFRFLKHMSKKSCQFKYSGSAIQIGQTSWAICRT